MKLKTKALATDLDGTLIPLSDANARDLGDLKSLLSQHSLKLAFVSGRHFSSVMEAIEQFDLPLPTCIICDVGTSVYEHQDGQFSRHDGFDKHLHSILQGADVADAKAAVLRCGEQLESWRLVEQEAEKQSRFKLSYYVDKHQLSAATNQIRNALQDADLPFSIVSSIDPFTDDGLVDLLPRGVAKGFALNWWRGQHNYACDDVVYAGDSGNDTAAFLTGVRSILVANMEEPVAVDILNKHPSRTCVYRAEGTATSGVLEGIRHFIGQ